MSYVIVVSKLLFAALILVITEASLSSVHFQTTYPFVKRVYPSEKVSTISKYKLRFKSFSNLERLGKLCGLVKSYRNIMEP